MDAPVITLRSPADVAGAVPHLVGFRPVDSLVVLALTGPRDRVTFSVRIDLPPPHAAAQAAAMCAARMELAGASAVLVAVFDDGDGAAPDDLPHARLVEELMRRSPAPVRDAVLVRSGRVWSYLCSEPGCCPVEGIPLDPTSPAMTACAAADAIAGRRVVADRAVLVAEAAPVGGAAAAAMQRTCRLMVARGVLGRPPGARYRARLAAALAGAEDRPPDLAIDDAAVLGLGWHHVAVRDELLDAVARADPRAAEVIRAVARLMPAPYDAPAAAMLAWVAYADGCGVVAGAALDRALASDPGYGLALLLADALARQLPPAEIRALWARFCPGDDGEVGGAGGRGRGGRSGRAGGGGDAAARRGRDARGGRG